MRVLNLFEGYRVILHPLDDGWVVELGHPDQPALAVRAWKDLPDAIESLHDLALMLVDETEIAIDAVATPGEEQALRAALTRHAGAGPFELPEDVDAPTERDRLREWFERQMGSKD